MRLNETPTDMPAHWRGWNDAQKLLWCRRAVESVDGCQHSPEWLHRQMDDLIGPDAGPAGDVMDHTPLSEHAAFVMTLG